MKTKRRKPRLDGYFAVGPGPMALKNVQGVYTPNAIPPGQYAIAYDDEGEARLQSESTFVSFEQAKATADWLSDSLD